MRWKNDKGVVVEQTADGTARDRQLWAEADEPGALQPVGEDEPDTPGVVIPAGSLHQQDEHTGE